MIWILWNSTGFDERVLGWLVQKEEPWMGHASLDSSLLVLLRITDEKAMTISLWKKGVNNRLDLALSSG